MKASVLGPKSYNLESPLREVPLYVNYVDLNRAFQNAMCPVKLKDFLYFRKPK